LNDRDRQRENERFEHYKIEADNYAKHWHDREQREERDRKAYDDADDDEPVRRSVTHTRSSRSSGGSSANPTGAFIVGGVILACTIYPWIMGVAALVLGAATIYEISKIGKK
jgi:pullulanase/glycogen debranching enzyme